MILSYNTTKNNQDNSSIGSVEEEEFLKIEDIMKRNLKKEEKKTSFQGGNQTSKMITLHAPKIKKESDGFGMSSESWEDNVSLGNTSGISKIDFAYQSSEGGSKRESINSISKDTLSRGEECIQKEVMNIIENDSMVHFI